MLKQAKELYIEILSVDDYIELFGKPNDTFGEQDQELLYKLIRQATTQFDSLISTYGNVSSLYQWWNNLKDNNEDNSKGFRLQKAIGSWVETMVQNGKFWTDGVPNMSSNIDYSLTSSSKNSNIELKRKDIIQDLVACGLTKTTNFGSDNDNNISNSDFEGVLITSKQFLADNYLALDSKSANQSVKSPINMSENGLENCGDIWNTNPNKHKITNYRLNGCVIDGDDNNQIINAKSAENAKKVLDTKDSTYKFLSQFDISYWNGLTKEEIYIAIASSDKVIQNGIPYKEGWIGLGSKGKDSYVWYESLINDNLNNTPPQDHPEAWKELPLAPIDMKVIQGYIDEQLAKLEQTKIKVEGISEVKEFATQQDYEAYRDSFGLSDSDFEDIVEEKYYINETIFIKGLVYDFIEESNFTPLIAKYNLQPNDYQVYGYEKYLIDITLSGEQTLSANIDNDFNNQFLFSPCWLNYDKTNAYYNKVLRTGSINGKSYTVVSNDNSHSNTYGDKQYLSLKTQDMSVNFSNIQVNKTYQRIIHYFVSFNKDITKKVYIMKE